MASEQPGAPFLERTWFERPVLEVARDLVGCELHWRGASGMIVETEAYCAVGDEASHIFSRPSTRAFLKTVPAGTAYVYFNYGIHWMLNVVVLPNREELHSPENGMVLFRALEPRRGVATMRERRRLEKLEALCSGPAKLTQALGIVGEDHGLDLCRADGRTGSRVGISRLSRSPCESAPIIATGSRIGISRSADLPWRFVVQGSRFLSKPLP